MFGASASSRPSSPNSSNQVADFAGRVRVRAVPEEALFGEEALDGAREFESAAARATGISPDVFPAAETGISVDVPFAVGIEVDDSRCGGAIWPGSMASRKRNFASQRLHRARRSTSFSSTRIAIPQPGQRPSSTRGPLQSHSNWWIVTGRSDRTGPTGEVGEEFDPKRAQ